MKRTLVVAIACLGLALLGITGCATKSPAPDTMGAQEQIEAVEYEQPSDPCTTIEGALARAAMLTHENFYGATQYDGTIRFAFDSYALSEEAKGTIDAFVSPLFAIDHNFFIELQGHTDGFGEEAYNFQLGLARAHAVMGYLYQKYGIPLQRMNGFSCGEVKPIADNSFPAGRAENRRVTLVVVE
jgi:outer membrane protein OmpA-like peptidoglycan-associated protein